MRESNRRCHQLWQFGRAIVLGSARVGAGVAVLLTAARVNGQTGCYAQHATSAAFVCYPNPSENSADSKVPDIFHLSAVGTALEGRKIIGYRVFLDDQILVDNKLALASQNVLVETNLKSPFQSGIHTLHLIVDGGGSAEVKGLEFYEAKSMGFCDPFTRVDPRVCNASSGRSMQWSAPPETQSASGGNIFARYAAFLALYGLNLKSIEADAGDAMKVDRAGNLYIASHAASRIDLRKYSPNGSLLYASLIDPGGDGFTSVASIAVDDAGRVWIAGNAAFPAKTGEPAASIEHTRISAFTVLVDTSKPASNPPQFLTRVADVTCHVNAIRIDSEGGAYIAGTTADATFPHDATLNLARRDSTAAGATVGFVSRINASGSIEWSAIAPNADFEALALDAAGNLYLTGSIAAPSKRELLIASLATKDRKINYLAELGGSGDQQGRAMTVALDGRWVFITGATSSKDFPVSEGAGAAGKDFAIALEPCQTGRMDSRILSPKSEQIVPDMAFAPVLDHFVAASANEIAKLVTMSRTNLPTGSILIAPACPARQ